MGIDGDFWYRVTTSRTGGLNLFEVESNGTRRDFDSLFSLELDAALILREIEKRAPEIVPYMRALSGLRVLRSSDPEETLFTFLCSANNNIRRITQMVFKLSAYGAPLLEADGRTLYRFPSCEAIAAIDEAELRRQGFGYRAQTIPHVARQVLDRGGRAWLEALKSGTYQAAHCSLTSLHSVGPKLADCICLFGLGFKESVPVDTHVWQAACRLYFPEWRDRAITPHRYQAVGDVIRGKLGDLAGWGHQHLFYENVLNWRSRQSS